MTSDPQEKSLTVRVKRRTLNETWRALIEMAADTARVEELIRQLDREIVALKRKSNAAKLTLQMLTSKTEDGQEAALFEPYEGSFEEIYSEGKTFQHSTLVDACQRILRDHAGTWLSKRQVEHLASVGGYQFTSANRRNSVDITLRRLGEKKYCEVKNTLGPAGNKYRWNPETEKGAKQESG